MAISVISEAKAGRHPLFRQRRQERRAIRAVVPPAAVLHRKISQFFGAKNSSGKPFDRMCQRKDAASGIRKILLLILPGIRMGPFPAALVEKDQLPAEDRDRFGFSCHHLSFPAGLDGALLLQQILLFDKFDLKAFHPFTQP